MISAFRAVTFFVPHPCGNFTGYYSPRRKSHFYASASMPAQKVAENFRNLKFSLGFMAHPCANFFSYSSARKKSRASMSELKPTATGALTEPALVSFTSAITEVRWSLAE